MTKNIEKVGRVGVLMGGTSSERDISLKSGGAILKALEQEKFNCVSLDLKSSDEDEIKQLLEEANLQMAFIALHGKCGEDGFVQKILEELKIPYTGSNVKANQRAFDKTLTQHILKKKWNKCCPF